jgi:zinc transporter 11
MNEAVVNALKGTFFTWGMTAAGAALVYIFPQGQKYRNLQQKSLDASLGFAGGVMLAASYWSLLAPAIEMAVEHNGYSEAASFVPAAVGFFLGALLVSAGESFVPDMSVQEFLREGDVGRECSDTSSEEEGIVVVGSPSDGARRRSPRLRARRTATATGDVETRVSATSLSGETVDRSESGRNDRRAARRAFRRVVLLVAAVTIHNLPEGLAVGVGFGAVGQSRSATLQSAWNLALGIGIQNFPEGFAVSIPLHRAGFSKHRSFWYGQLSGMVEPVAGLLGALAVNAMQVTLPYALGFAAGAMIFVVVDDLIPEAHASSNSALASWGAILGFLVMMSLDVSLG